VHRWILALSLAAASPVAASAQFTTFIAPPDRVKDSIKAATVAEQRAVADSITHAQITGMKAWVDSAGGIAPIPPRTDTKTWVDSAANALSQPPRIDTTLRPTPITATSNGVVAPATASSLPFILVVGGSAMLIGLILLRRPLPAKSRSER